MTEDKRRKNDSRKSRASKSRKLYRRFIWGILYYLREQFPSQAIRYNERVLRLRVEVSDLEDRNLYLEEEIDNIEAQIETEKCKVAACNAKIGSPYTEIFENCLKVCLGVVTLIVLFKIFSISLVDFSSSFRSKWFIIVPIVFISAAIVFLVSSLITGAICYIKEEEWNKNVIPSFTWSGTDKNGKVKEGSFPVITLRWLFILACLSVILIEGFSGGYLASELIKDTVRQESQQEIAKLSTDRSERELTAKRTAAFMKQSDDKVADSNSHKVEVSTFMSLLASINIAWSVIKGIKLKATKGDRENRSSSDQRVEILWKRKLRYATNMFLNKRKIERLEKIIAKYWDDEDVEEAYTGTSKNNTAGEDYTGKYPPMPDQDTVFNDERDFGEEDDFYDDDYASNFDEEDESNASDDVSDNNEEPVDI
jgi:hypothetical protein